MTDAEQRAAAKQFAKDWSGKGYEKGESQPFWYSLLQKVYGIKEPDKFIDFERQVLLDHTSFIDGFIPATHVLIEQKGLGKDLNKPIKQSDGTLLTPFQQAKRYSAEIAYSERPRWIVTCNFKEFYIYDMERPTGEPEIVLLENLGTEYYRLQFLVDTGDENIKKEMEISLQAGEIVGALYDALLKEYKDPDDPETLKNLNALCVRLVFCLYAEDAVIFGSHKMFHNYLKGYSEKETRQSLINLFKILDTEIEKRDPYLDEDLLAFPYVNGGLFADENIVIPRLNETIIDLILHKASENFDWSAISPTIFGAVFESTLNPETRRKGGMHYTSIENIHKVIDPLFLDELKKELQNIKEIQTIKTKEKKLNDFQTKLSELKFLDPACGSGNFLTETYISLRRIENEVIKLLIDCKKGTTEGQIILGSINPIKVSIGQFYGIEINDFAVTVAKTALWIAESQMMKETEDIVHMSLDFLPLKSYANIIEGNALRIDWESVIPKNELNYIMGNRPFVGHQWRTYEQISDMDNVFFDWKTYGKLDYVAAWYKKAFELIRQTQIECAFVSTNSICQGESVSIMWKPLFKNGLCINFAHQTFRWDSETKVKAHVHCIIVGFSAIPTIEKFLFDSSGQKTKVENINGYLLCAPNIFIQNRGSIITVGLPKMGKGSQPTDGGNLLLSSDEKKELITKYPITEKWIRRFMMGEDFINNKFRYCLWLVGVNPAELRKCTDIMLRLERIAELRRKSPTASVRRDANTPMLFTQIRQPTLRYLAIPRVSSERRRYIPMAFLEPEIIAGDKLQFIEGLNLYHFGCLTSNVHNAWMRVVSGRLKSDYSYSPAVYNNFPWCNPTPGQKAKIQQTAQAILNARALYPDSSLADLYDELTMPPELRKAHQQNDKAVMQAYGFSVKDMTESKCVAELMKLYQTLTKKD